MPASRLRLANDEPRNANGKHVVYWMIASRRTQHNFALERAVELANEHDVGLIVLEALRCGHRWASDRIHAFVIAGMADNSAVFSASRAAYFPYLETQPGQGSGLLAALAEQAVAVVTDDFPCFFLPRMIAAAAKSLPVSLEAIDGNGVYPLSSTDRVFTTAASFRRHLQKELREHLGEMPVAEPLQSLRAARPVIPAQVTERWPLADLEAWTTDESRLAALPIDHDVRPVEMRGGRRAGLCKLTEFVDSRLDRYGERNHPDTDVASGLSPYLHFGFVSAHEVFAKVMDADGWDPSRIAEKATGSRSGWWGASSHVESFLDELITWREIGYNMCHKRGDYASFDALPDWARATLEEHASDPRETIYSLDQLASASTDDRIWNAAQNQLRRDGVIHNYLRMLWGKRVLEWTHSPRAALKVLIELNNRYALDGRNPNSYSGIFWVFGRYDRAWGPERKIFGKVRYMTSASTKRKLRLTGYLDEFAPAPRPLPV